MQKTRFKIAQMDCPCEEQLVRMGLEGMDIIKSLDFDLSKRELTVFHTEDFDSILQKLDALKLNTSLINSFEVQEAETIANDTQEKKVLWQVLVINLFFFAFELIAGFIAGSMGLVADSLDMLADSFVYGLALLAVGGTLSRKKAVAKASGYFQLVLAVLGLIEIIRRFIGLEPVPSFEIMIIVSILALIGNTLCLYLLQKNKSRESHMQASMIFTSNDIIVNIGVILAGGLVYLTQSKYPDLIIGIIVFMIIGRGVIRILKLAK